MSRTARRILITLIVALAAFGVLWVVTHPAPPTHSAQTQPALAASNTATAPASQPAASTAPTTPVAATAPSLTAATQPLAALKAMPPESGVTSSDVAPQSLGSLDPRQTFMQLNFTRLGAGISTMKFSDIWQSALAKRKAEIYLRNVVANGAIYDPSQLDESDRYVLQAQQPFFWGNQQFQVPVLAAHSIIINGVTVGLLANNIWGETASGKFETRIVDANGKPIAQIVRQYTLGKSYEINLQQRVFNLSDQTLEIQWKQYGPQELNPEGYIDVRRFAIGYLPFTKPGTIPDTEIIERSTLLSQYTKANDPSLPATERLEKLRVWPNRTSKTHGYTFSWFAATNRYFGLAIHPPLTNAAGSAVNPNFSNTIDEVRFEVSPPSNNPAARVFTFLISPTSSLAPQGQASFDLGVYAGPLDRYVLTEEPYSNLAMEGLILYRMAGGCCTFLTFQWLAHLLLGFLSVLHDYMLFDWGLAIIGLVMVVRAILHPLTKRAQINMQRFSKSMASMKPEIDKVQAKYKDDPKKAQQEQVRLMREHGVNPLQMLGCLPMFLQTPIWIALWAMLYLAFDIRQQPAFYGAFQLFNHWSFLADLSIQDNFLNLGKGFVIPLVGWQVTSINLLPILMGVVFFVQQKYMSPPPGPTMTAEQIQQQRIMKVMMVLMMPLFLYKAPSGLTLYMVTSSCIGILESRYIRKHINEMDLNPSKPQESFLSRNMKKIKDPRTRAYAEALERAKAKRNAEPPKSFKKRK